jgi:zinc transport system substrate-binding protein
MKRTLQTVTGLFLLIALGISACSEQTESTGNKATTESTAAQLSVYVVNYPLQYFAQRIGGPDVRVTFPAPADGDPAFWKPSPEQIAAYQKADLILLNGAAYAKWVSHASLPASRMVDTSASFADRFIPLEDQVTHSHGLAGKHEHGDVAFTIWLDPQQAILQARAVRDALIRKRPGAAGDFNQRFDSLSKDLQDLDDRMAAVVAAGASRPLVFSHPVYQYLIRRYGLDGQEVHWEPEESPTPEQWAELERLLTEHPARWMIWEGTPNPATVEELKTIGLDSLTFDPCGNVPDSGDYLGVMRENALHLEKAFSQ